MTVANQVPYKSYTANGTQSNFALGFYVDSKEHFEVKKNEQVVAKSQYIYESGSNSLIFNTPPNTGDKIEITRATTTERTNTYTTYNNSFRPEVLNLDIDRVWLKLQELGVADQLLRVYTDRLHIEQQSYIENQDQLIRNLILDLRNYVNQQDSGINSSINNLKSYVDRQDNVRNSYFENLIHNQGVALNQLDHYYDYLIERIAKISTDREWVTDFVVTASGQNQQQVNDLGGVAYWYDKPLGFPKHAEVRLLDGRIVKSLVDNNSKNPNVDMTEWEFPQAKASYDKRGLNQQEVNDEVISQDGLQHLQFDDVLKKDGTQQAPELYINVLSNKRNKALAGSHYHPLNEMIFDGRSLIFDGNGSRFQATGTRRLFNIINTIGANPRVDIRNTEFEQDWNPDVGSGGSNNNPLIRFRALENPRAFLNRLTGSMGISTSAYNEVDSQEQVVPNKFATICFNFFKDMQKQCVEGFGSEHNVIIGNSGDVPLLNSNALRVTGASTPFVAYNKASVYVGNTFKGGQGETVSGKYASGISVQTYVQGLSAVANASQGFHWGVNLKGGTTLANQSRGNYIQSSAVDSDYAVYAESPRSEHTVIAAYNYKDGGIHEVTSNESANLKKGVMKYDGILVAGTNTVGSALKIINDGSQFNLLLDLQEGGKTARNTIYGKNHSGVISVYGSSDGAIFLYCDDSNLQITVKDTDDTDRTKVAIRIYGKNNTITVNTKGSVRCENGSESNVIFGKVGTMLCTESSSSNTFFGQAMASTQGFGINGNTVHNPLMLSEIYTPGVIPANSIITKSVNMPGVTLGQSVVAAFSNHNDNLELYATVSTTNTVRVKFKNISTNPLDLNSGTLIVKRV